MVIRGIEDLFPAKQDMTVRSRIPYWVKILYLVWLVILLPSYWVFHGPQNLLWLCDAASIVLLFALWRESALLMSSQACGVVLVQLVWTVDVMFRFFFGGASAAWATTRGAGSWRHCLPGCCYR
jgi:hypothetical protein